MFFHSIHVSTSKHLFALCALTSFISFVVTIPSIPQALRSDYEVAKREALPEVGFDNVPVVGKPLVAEEHELVERSPAGGAGLAWGPVTIGNLKLYLTNPHNGYAGPRFPNAPHVNFHVDRQRPAPYYDYKPVVNMHIVKYERGGSSCLYVWDSVTRTDVFDNCFDDFTDAISEAVDAIKNFVDDLLTAANPIASIAIIAALAVAIAAAIAGLGVVAVAA